MGKITIPLSEVLQARIMELCNLKGVDYLSFIGDSDSLLIGAIGTEFLKFVDTGLKCDTDSPISIRVPSKIIKTVATIGFIDLIIGDKLLIQKRHTATTVVAQITLPLEMDFNSDLLHEMNFAAKQQEGPAISMQDVLALKELLKIGMTGIQVKDGRAFINGNGYYVYKPFPSEYAFIMTNDCLAMMASFISKSGKVQLFTNSGYIIAKKDTVCFGWKKTRTYMSDTWDVFQQQRPIFEVGCDLFPISSIIKGIAIEKTSTYSCILDFQQSRVVIQAGTLGTYELAFSTPSSREDYTVSVPFDIFKLVVSASTTDLQHLVFKVYQNFVCMQWGTTQVLIIGDVDAIH